MSEAINARLIAVGAAIKAKGWNSAMVAIYTEYLGIFDREAGPLDPMISYRPSIRSTPRDARGYPMPAKEYVRDGWDCKSMDDALAKLEKAATEMPTMAEEIARISDAKSKLSDDEKRLLGIS